MQLDAEGFEVNPGEAIRYVMLDRCSRDPRGAREGREVLVDGDEQYDAEAYVDLVLRGAEGMLLPFGYDLAKLTDARPGKVGNKQHYSRVVLMRESVSDKTIYDAVKTGHKRKGRMH